MERSAAASSVHGMPAGLATHAPAGDGVMPSALQEFGSAIADASKALELDPK